MDNFKYIDLENFKILDSPKGYISCDKELAVTIAILNEKGYKTKSSCAGHNKIEYITDDIIYNITELEKLKELPYIKIHQIKDNNIYCKTEVIGVSTYINFDKDYNFEKIPQGFTYDKGMLVKLVDFYDDTVSKRKENIEIETELKNNWEALLKWANKLKHNKNKGE